ncbi:flagellar protein FliO/FliZ [Pararobbsia alpina]|uniref:flagellar biosynthetic protein FliO n=1 Tax=Pararobbsia alpina TaxID=621374 RepID=UPI0039A52DB1
MGSALALLLATAGLMASQAAQAAGEQAAGGSIVASGVVGGGLNSAARAASQAVDAGSAVPSLGLAGIFQALFGLVVVIGLIFGCAWIARRLGLNKTPPRTGLVKLVSTTPLSQKERVVVVEIEDTWLVLGVAPGSVSHLHTLPAGEAAASPAPVSPQVAQFATDFRQRLSEKLGKSPRRNVHDDDIGAAR